MKMLRPAVAAVLVTLPLSTAALDGPGRRPIGGAIEYGNSVHNDGLSAAGGTMAFHIMDTVGLLDVATGRPRLSAAVMVDDPAAKRSGPWYAPVVTDGHLVVADQPGAKCGVWERVGPDDLAWRSQVPYCGTKPKVLSEGHLFISSSGLLVYDLRDPSNPLQAAWFITGGGATPLAVDHGVAVVTERPWVTVVALNVFDVTDPTNPDLVAALEPADAFELDGGYLFTAGAGLLRVFDMATPEQPELIGSAALPGTAVDIDVAEGLAAVATGADGATLFDVTDPASPEQLARVAAEVSVDEVVIAGGRVVLNDGRLRVLSVTGGSAILQTGEMAAPRWGHRVDAANGYGYAADLIPVAGQNGFHVLDLSDPETPISVAQVDVDRLCATVVVHQGVLLLGCEDGVLSVFDLSEPSDPARIGEVAVGPVLGIGEAADGFAFLPTATPELVIADVRDASAPVVAGRVALPAVGVGVALTGEHAYVAAGSAGLRAIWVGDPIHAVEVGALEPVGSSERFVAVEAIGDGRLAVLDESLATLRIVDVSSASNPIEVTEMPLGTRGYAGSLAFDGRFLYVLARRYWPTVDRWDSWVAVVDLEDTDQPLVVGALDVPGTDAFAVEIEGDRIYVTGNHALWTYDLWSTLLMDGFESGTTARWSGSVTSMK